jgi:hypothetical protein
MIDLLKRRNCEKTHDTTTWKRAKQLKDIRENHII